MFPGQGAQQPGMAQEIVRAAPRAREVMERAGEALGFDLWRIVREGPANELEATDVCQPAILATSVAVIEALVAEKKFDPNGYGGTAGLSLGEYTALWFAGCLSFEDALRLVRRRGQAMQAASDREPSGMISLIGASREQAENLARAGSAAGVLVTANFLGPGTIALSGAVPALDLAEKVAKDHGVRRCVRLKVAGAFHSPLMAPATDALTAALAEIEIHPPRIPFVSNVTGDFVTEPAKIRELLARQVTAPVLWEDGVRRLFGAGIRRFLEPAPGKVLSGLSRKIVPEAISFGVESQAEFQAFE